MGNDTSKANNTVGNGNEKETVFISYNMVEAQLIVNLVYLMYDKSKGNCE